MKKIIVVSDSHRNNLSLKKILAMYPNAYTYLHLGDSEQSESEIYPFISVKGNNDYLIDNETKVIEIKPLRIFLTHGHKMYLSKDNMVRHAKKYDCNMFLYGHTHIPFYEYYENVHLLNPGSLAYPRSPIGETYAIIIIFDNDEVDVQIKQL